MPVVGHTNTKENDIADEVVKQDADMHFIGPDPFFGNSKRQLKKELQEWGEKELGQTQTKKFINS